VQAALRSRGHVRLQVIDATTPNRQLWVIGSCATTRARDPWPYGSTLSAAAARAEELNTVLLGDGRGRRSDHRPPALRLPHRRHRQRLAAWVTFSHDVLLPARTWRAGR